MLNSIPAFFKPTLGIVIDDDAIFGQMLSKCLSNASNSQITYKQILHDEDVSSLENNYSKLISACRMGSDNLRDFLNNTNLVSVLIIDCYAGCQNGLDLARSIKNPLVSKIMMSHSLDDKDAIEAINNKWIDYYFSKMNENFIEKLCLAITHAQKRLFQELSFFIPDYYSGANPLLDEELINIFNSICKKFNAIYHESSCDFKNLRLFNQNNQHVASIQFFEEREVIDLLNSYQAESAPSNIKQMIEKEQMLPFFPDGIIKDGSEWINYLQPVKVFGKQKKYFFIVSEI